jgi:hypothetical protein
MKKLILILFLTVFPFLSNCLAVESVDSLRRKFIPSKAIIQAKSLCLIILIIFHLSVAIPKGV